MKKLISQQIVFAILCFNVLFSYSVNNELVFSANPNGFINAHNSFHNEYYKNNNVKVVTASNTIKKTIYYYNKNGDLHKIKSSNIDSNSNEYNIIDYNFTYKNNILKQILYNDDGLLTHSNIEYQNDLIIKISDFRDTELFYYTDYKYNNNNTLIYSKHTRLNSIGVRFGTSPVTFEYNYFYTNNGNLLNTEVSYQNREYEQSDPYEYSENSNLPNKIGETILTYTYFQ